VGILSTLAKLTSSKNIRISRELVPIEISKSGEFPGFVLWRHLSYSYSMQSEQARVSNALRQSLAHPTMCHVGVL
jgi:hypothetical protein